MVRHHHFYHTKIKHFLTVTAETSPSLALQTTVFVGSLTEHKESSEYSQLEEQNGANS